MPQGAIGRSKTEKRHPDRTSHRRWVIGEYAEKMPEIAGEVARHVEEPEVGISILGDRVQIANRESFPSEYSYPVSSHKQLWPVDPI